MSEKSIFDKYSLEELQKMGLKIEDKKDEDEYTEDEEEYTEDEDEQLITEDEEVDLDIDELNNLESSLEEELEVVEEDNDIVEGDNDIVEGDNDIVEGDNEVVEEDNDIVEEDNDIVEEDNEEISDNTGVENYGDIDLDNLSMEELDNLENNLKDKEEVKEEIIMKMEYEETDLKGKYRDTLYDRNGLIVPFQNGGEIYTQRIKLDDIKIPPRTRKGIDDTEDLEKLILQWGLIEPLHVMPYGDKYLLIHGFRRFNALKRLGEQEAICLVDTTRPKIATRFLEAMCNNTKKLNFFEMLDFGDYVESHQNTFQSSAIEAMLGLEPGDYLKAKYISQFDEFGVISEILSGRRTIKEGFKKLERELDKIEKEREQALKETYDERGLPTSYAELIEQEAHIQDVKNREILPKALTDRINARDRFVCQTCGLGYHNPELTPIFEKHHIIPVSMGGNDSEGNLILLCSNCHKIVTAYIEGNFIMPQKIDWIFKNILILGNIAKMGVSDGKTPYEVYMNECSQPWLKD